MGDPLAWADYQPLVAKGYDTAESKRAVRQASQVLWALSGRKFHSAGSHVDVYELVQQPGGPALYGYPRREAAFGLLSVALTRRPVRSIAAVTIIDYDGSTTSMTETTDWYLQGNRIVFRFVTTPRQIVRVDYEVRSNLPGGTHTIVLALAEQYLLAAAGKSCNLPQRVQSISRQGLSWTLLDPAEFLDKHLTGVIPIDSWLRQVNPSGNTQPARLFNPAEPRLVKSEWLREPFESVDMSGTTYWYGHGEAVDLEPSWLAAHGSPDVYVNVDTDVEEDLP